MCSYINYPTKVRPSPLALPLHPSFSPSHPSPFMSSCSSQVVFRSCKLIPTMVMAGVMNNRRFSPFEYAAALAVCVVRLTSNIHRAL